MKGSALRRQYDRLTPSERVALFLAACVRRDEVEVRALQRSCPVEHAREVLARVEAFAVPAHRLASCWSAAMRLRAAGEVFSLAIAALARNRSAMTALLAVRDAAGQPLVGPIHGLLMVRWYWQAWERFAARLGVDPRHAAFHAEWILADLDSVAADLEELDRDEADLTSSPDSATGNLVDRIARLFEDDYRGTLAEILGTSPRT